MKDTSHTTLGYQVPVKAYTSLAEISQAAGGEAKAVDQINKLLLGSHATRLKAAVVAAVSTVTGGKKEPKTSPETFAASAKGKEAEVLAALSKSPVALSIVPVAPVRVLKPVPNRWLEEAKKLLASQGKDKLIASLKARGHTWTPDTTQALDQGANLESLGRIVQALHVNPLGL